MALAFALVCTLLLLGPVRRLGVDTDTADMISEDLPWRQTYVRYKEAFPTFVDQLVVVVEGETPDLADRAQRRLAGRLREEPELFADVYLPDGGPFFRRHALLYLSETELDSLVENLGRYAPWLRRLERDPSLEGFLGRLGEMLAEVRRGEESAELAPLLGAVAGAFRASLEWRFHELSWQELLWGRLATAGERRALILVQPRLDHGSLLPAAVPLERLREIAGELRLDPAHGVRMRLTGQVAMEHEELLAVLRGARRAGVLALLGVSLILYLGLGSVRLVAAAVATLLAGLVGTAGFAAIAVGHLNLISVAFAVLFIGLGIDYAIHFCLRYRELRAGGAPGAADLPGPADLPGARALRGAAADVGPSIALSAVTTAACFYAFVPTDFTGVSELGLISGTGMFVGLIVTLTLLPALLALWPPRIERTAEPAAEHPAAERPAAERPEAAALGRPPVEPGPLDRAAALLRRLGHALAAAPRRHPPRVLAVAAATGLASLLLVPGLRFDPNPLNLRDPETESVAAYLELLTDTAAYPLTVSMLEPDERSARATAERVATLRTVEGTVTLEDFVPERQAEKRERIARIAGILGPPGEPSPGEPPAGGRAPPATGAPGEAAGAGVAGVRRLLDELAGSRPFASPEAAGAARYLGFQARAWLARAGSLPPGDRARMVERLERSLVGSLPGRIDALRAALDPGRLERGDLPPELVARWVSPAGLHRVEVLPSGNVARTEALRRFVEDVLRAAPRATGAPVVEIRAGDAVVRAFRNAFLYAGAATVGLLLLTLRRLPETAFVLLPLLLAGLLTVAVSVALGLPLNFANVIALPLLLGVGVDNGIHMVHRARAAPPAHGDLLRTSTARAVVFASLTTVVGFGNLALTGHPGTESLGALLTIGMVAVMVCTLAVIPALLGLAGPGSEGTPAATDDAPAATDDGSARGDDGPGGGAGAPTETAPAP